MADDIRAALEAAIERLNDGDRAGYLELFDPTAELHGYPAGIDGVAGARHFYDELWTAFPDARVTIDDVLVDGDRAAVRYTLRGTQRADYLGVAPRGRAVEAVGISIARFAEGRVVEEWHAPTELMILSQLGAIATTSTPAGPGERRPLPRRSASAEAAALRWEEKLDDDG